MAFTSSVSDADKQVILNIIAHYDRQYPTGVDSIAAAVVSSQREIAELELVGKVSKKTGVINNNQSGRRVTVAIPQGLYIILMKQYPSLFKADLSWFKRNFKMFVVGK